MLVWLASYPRSGNTLLRSILHKVFSVEVPSVYPEGLTSGEHDWGDVIPRFARPDDLSIADFPDWARAQAALLVTKTHELPDEGDDPAIVLVRDGRAAMSSYERYIAQFTGKPSELEEIVIGAAPLFNWSDWIQAWTERTAPTLLLHYEQFSRNPESTIKQLASFLGISPLGSFDITFGEMKAINPTLFAVGHNEHGIGEVERRCPNLFWSLHGDMMRELGYGGSDISALEPPMIRAAFEEAGRAIRRAKHSATG